jgi:hypothetical protein
MAGPFFDGFGQHFFQFGLWVLPLIVDPRSAAEIEIWTTAPVNDGAIFSYENIWARFSRIATFGAEHPGIWGLSVKLDTSTPYTKQIPKISRG